MHATGDEKEHLHSRSCPLFHHIKQEYYTTICEAANPANIWSLAKWGMGTRSTPIPPLKGVIWCNKPDNLKKRKSIIEWVIEGVKCARALGTLSG